MHDFTRLEVWRRARELTADVYRTTRDFPRDELFGLARQMRRSASSVGANLAEGAGRATPKDFARFMTISIGSLSELENHCFTAADLGFIDEAKLGALRDEVRQLRAMTLSLRRTMTRSG